MPKYLINVTPSPPHCGEKMKVCYDFPSSPPPSSVVLEVEFDPSTGSASYVLTPTSNCVEVTVPEDAISVVITDTSGFSEPYASVTIE